MKTSEKIGKIFGWLLIISGILHFIVMFLQIFIKQNLLKDQFLNLFLGFLLIILGYMLIMYVNNAIKKRKILEQSHIRRYKKK